MADLSVTISFVAILGLVAGILVPEKSLFWFGGKRSRRNVLKIYSFLLALSFIMFVLTEGSSGA